MAIALADLLNARHVRLGLRSRSAENAIRELVELLAATEEIAEPQNFAGEVIAREQKSPSVVELGVAFPHARTDTVPDILLAIGRKTAGVPFGTEGTRANLIFLIGVPQRLVNDYLVCVVALARIARKDECRVRLLRAATAEERVEILRSASPPEG